MENNKPINGNCWVACCDILGFKKKIKDFECQFGEGSLDIFVEQYYDIIITELKTQDKYFPDDVFSASFSDTFLFFTRDDSIQAFEFLHSTFDSFYRSVMTRDNWPLRGAIGFGQLYADIPKNIFLGSGIINAYEYSEKQNWIGSIVTQEANNRLKELNVDLSQFDFKEYLVPFHKNGRTDLPEKLFVSKIHYNWPDVVKSIKQMQKELESNKDIECAEMQKIIIKYNNTLKFFKECP
ncbi:MAG: hypothetical protein JW715_13955 [Sedimentisphaerales bacterium]|nr:hypothetical protein [Sedimentisphaerales bacterium]